ncbi:MULTISPECIES: hypothetical protein [Alphaproteobacteria]|jgi:hypothetical protein|uniref:Uncharacterized protein n=1 Tax=Maricaulis virginensis TaxID=144022 RepID=A0A9W6IR01_9PROT|nr:hypothetical protein [Maricaulis virginensis]GLK53526.1 hypothetical protein GCM10017621_30340 [Maricaulis virginensis]
MFALIADLSEDFVLDFSDDGGPSSPMLRTFYTSAALQNTRIMLNKIQSAVDLVIASWARGDRCAAFDIHEQSGQALVQLVNASRSLYAIAGNLVYSDQVWRNGPWPSSQTTPHLRVLERANQQKEHRIFVGGTAQASLSTLLTAGPGEILVCAGYYDVGTRSGTNVLSFSDEDLDEELLMQIHEEAADALALCHQRLQELEQLKDIPLTIGDYQARWERVWDDIYAHHPVPYGVEPGGAFRIGVSSSAAAE